MVTLLLWCAVGVDFQPVDMTKLAGESAKFYAVVKGEEIEVKGRLVRSVEVGRLTDPGAGQSVPEGPYFGLHCPVAMVMRNRTDVALRPRIRIALWNRYGVRLGVDEVKWRLDRVMPSASASENVAVWLTDYKAAFRFSGVPLPKDFGEPTYLAIADNSD